MSVTMDDNIKRWTAKRKATLVVVGQVHVERDPRCRQPSELASGVTCALAVIQIGEVYTRERKNSAIAELDISISPILLEAGT